MSPAMTVPPPPSAAAIGGKWASQRRLVFRAIVAWSQGECHRSTRHLGGAKMIPIVRRECEKRGGLTDTDVHVIGCLVATSEESSAQPTCWTGPRPATLARTKPL